METFPIVKRKDEQRHGEYRTKRVILEIYDEMARATATGDAYHTRPGLGQTGIQICCRNAGRVLEIL